MLSFGFFFGRVAGVLLLNFALARVPIKTIMVTCAVVLTLGSAASGLLGVGLWPLALALFVTGLAGVIPNAISGVWVAAHVHKGLEKAMLNIGAYFALGVVVAPARDRSRARARGHLEMRCSWARPSSRRSWRSCC